MDQKKDFFKDVFQVVELIPEGRVTSYGAIAKCLGAARSSRLVGWALNASFKSPVNIPAHRVVNRLGMLSGATHFLTPTAMEERLTAEGHQIVDNQIVDFKAVYWDPLVELAL
ncbi:MAG: MGMT family protein [Crocinitomix sp.]|nr:MGMT family protein [Crocinitomix sp.]